MQSAITASIIETSYKEYKNNCIKNNIKINTIKFIEHCKSKGLTGSPEDFVKAFWKFVSIKAVQAKLNSNI